MSMPGEPQGLSNPDTANGYNVPAYNGPQGLKNPDTANGYNLPATAPTTSNAAAGPSNAAAGPSNAALDTSINAWASSVGLGSLAPWINQQVHKLAGQGMGASDITTTIADTINTAPGFDALMPGYNERIKNGYSNTDASSGAGIAGYISFRQQLNAFAETAGLVPGTLSNTDIGDAWSRDASIDEMSTRITQDYTAAAAMMQSAPGQQMLNELKNYGYTQSLTPGQLLSYYINPVNTTNVLQQQLNSAVVGGEGNLTGFGEIGQSKAMALQAFLSNNGQNALNPTQASSFFNSNVGNGLSSISQMAQTGFEQAQLGTSATGPGIVTQDQLLGAAQGNAQSLQAVQRAAQTRSASSAGGGGLAAGQSGVSGVGFGSQ